MTLTQVWGALVVFLVCPLLGSLPLIDWITYAWTGHKLSQVGTGNVGVSAAFYHGGRWVGIFAVLSEATKGIAAVLLTRIFFPSAPEWEVIALVALVLGRYWVSRGAGTTNVVWGYLVHDWITAFLVFVIGGIGFTLLREKQLGRLGVLVLLPVITALRHPQDGLLIGANVTLSILLGWIFQKMPDDLDLSPDAVHRESRQVFQFFRGDRALITLDRALDASKVGAKAATLAQLKRWGYPVPEGWVLPPGDDPAPLIAALNPSADAPLIVRSSAIGEDSSRASAAGLYESFPNITSQDQLELAIAQCQMSYNRPTAVRYRRDRRLPDMAMAVIVQVQVNGAFSGVAFSRDPILRCGDVVAIEALPGYANRVVSGQVTPEQYRVRVRDRDLEPTSILVANQAAKPEIVKSEIKQPPHRAPYDQIDGVDWVLPDTLNLEMEGEGNVPPRLIQQVAYLARHLERQYHGIPQDIEWSYDGQQLWILQSRPIPTLLPIWTRKIAAEVIPGFIRPLTWSINQPLTCGVWGEIFKVVLGYRAYDLDFNDTATLHHSAAYFNASLLGEIFDRMGLPPESLEFLTRGAKFSKPPIGATLKNLPGLLRLIGREFSLEQDFEQDNQIYFKDELAELSQNNLETLSPKELLERIEHILVLLERVTYYNILAPLSLALRQAILNVSDTDLDQSQLPEIASLRALQALALDCRPFLPNPHQSNSDPSTIFATLSEHPDGQSILNQLDQFLERYGYLSEVATDIAVPTWAEDPRSIRELFAQFLVNPNMTTHSLSSSSIPGWKRQWVQNRLDLKGRVAQIYNRLLAELRWSIVALEKVWISQSVLNNTGDIFFLKIQEIRQAILLYTPEFIGQFQQWVAMRRSQWEEDVNLTPIPSLVYGNDPPNRRVRLPASSSSIKNRLQGIGASPGIVEGRVLIVQGLQATPALEQDTILVVPYTDSGWAPLLAQAGGLIAETGGRLSHGAIIAREYGIPAVMDVQEASQYLKNGQHVRLDGQHGVIEIL